MGRVWGWNVRGGRNYDSTSQVRLGVAEGPQKDLWMNAFAPKGVAFRALSLWTRGICGVTLQGRIKCWWPSLNDCRGRYGVGPTCITLVRVKVPTASRASTGLTGLIKDHWQTADKVDLTLTHHP